MIIIISECSRSNLGFSSPCIVFVLEAGLPKLFAGEEDTHRVAFYPSPANDSANCHLIHQHQHSHHCCLSVTFWHCQVHSSATDKATLLEQSRNELIQKEAAIQKASQHLPRHFPETAATALFFLSFKFLINWTGKFVWILFWIATWTWLFYHH